MPSASGNSTTVRAAIKEGRQSTAYSRSRVSLDEADAATKYVADHGDEFTTETSSPLIRLVSQLPATASVAKGAPVSTISSFFYS
jgi:hypothetical protein